MSAYAETCAAIGNVYVNYRLFLLHGESKYYDVLERTLYNGLISGVSLDGGKFFYPNPQESMGQHQRQPWFGCACCPSNICRFIPSLPGYVYAVKDRNLYVNLFLSNSATMKVGGKEVKLSQETQYPWNGDIALKIEDNRAGRFNMKQTYMSIPTASDPLTPCLSTARRRKPLWSPTDTIPSTAHGRRVMSCASTSIWTCAPYAQIIRWWLTAD